MNAIARLRDWFLEHILRLFSPIFVVASCFCFRFQQAFSDEVCCCVDRQECELEEARRLFEVQEARHRRCTINCSVRRAAPFYEKRKLHDATFTSQVAALETVERAIHEARHKLENVQRRIGGSPPTNTAHMPYESILEELIPGSEIFQEAGDDGFESCDSEDERK